MRARTSRRRLTVVTMTVILATPRDLARGRYDHTTRLGKLI
jgi:hypothetical protein